VIIKVVICKKKKHLSELVKSELVRFHCTYVNCLWFVGCNLFKPVGVVSLLVGSLLITDVSITATLCIVIHRKTLSCVWSITEMQLARMLDIIWGE
jgi:hypothetical protein